MRRPPEVGPAPGAAPSFAGVAEAALAAAASPDVADALRSLADAARTASGAELALVRALGGDGERLEAVAVAAPEPLAGELEGTPLAAAELPEAPLDDLERAPAAVRRAAARVGATRLFLVPARTDGYAVSLELLRRGEPFRPEQRIAAELCAAQAVLVLRAFGLGREGTAPLRPALDLAGDALAVAAAEPDAPGEVVRLAAEA
ncbi:MAG TPA: hypothetical protein VE995_08130, partial [Gaiellaceae bacterium]|nr:hypothetical protein [Gaiellaceae bacterium]